MGINLLDQIQTELGWYKENETSIYETFREHTTYKTAIDGYNASYGTWNETEFTTNLTNFTKQHDEFKSGIEERINCLIEYAKHESAMKEAIDGGAAIMKLHTRITVFEEEIQPYMEMGKKIFGQNFSVLDPEDLVSLKDSVESLRSGSLINPYVELKKAHESFSSALSESMGNMHQIAYHSFKALKDAIATVRQGGNPNARVTAALNRIYRYLPTGEQVYDTAEGVVPTANKVATLNTLKAVLL